MKKHHGVHGESKPFPCRMEGVNCTKRFKDPSTRTRHEKTVHMKKMVHCSEPGCGVAFVSDANLKKHAAERHCGTAAWNPQAEVLQHAAAQAQHSAPAGGVGGKHKGKGKAGAGISRKPDVRVYFEVCIARSFVKRALLMLLTCSPFSC